MGFGKVTGLKDVLNSLEAIGDSIETEALQNRIKQESQIIIDSAKSFFALNSWLYQKAPVFLEQYQKGSAK